MYLDRRADGHIGLVFESLEDMFANCDHDSGPWDPAWLGEEIESLDHAARFSRTWSKGGALANRLADALQDKSPVPVSRRRVQCWADDGDELDTDRRDAGMPCWRTTRRQARTGPTTVSIVANVVASCQREPDEIIWRGAAAIALARILEHAGFRVAVWACESSLESHADSPDGETQVTLVNLKQPEDPLDVSGLAAATSGWFFRTWFFAACAVPGAPARGYGKALSIPGWAEEYTGPAIMVDDLWDRPAAEQWLAEQLERLS